MAAVGQVYHFTLLAAVAAHLLWAEPEAAQHLVPAVLVQHHLSPVRL
jgi:hypothetical protein